MALEALEAEVKSIVRRAVQVLRDYAATQGWGQDDYRIYVYPNLDWNRLQLILVARALPRKDYLANYNAVCDFIEERLKDDPWLKHDIGVVLRTFDQVEQGGLYAIPRSYLDADDL